MTRIKRISNWHAIAMTLTVLLCQPWPHALAAQHDHGPGHEASGEDAHAHDDGPAHDAPGADHPEAPDDGHAQSGHAHEGGRTIPVTVWTDRYEVFLEVPPLVAGEPAPFVTHITVLDGFVPRRRGPVTFVLEQGRARLTHVEDQPRREGIYLSDLVFSRPGIWKLTLQIPEDGSTFTLSLGELTVYADAERAAHAPLPPALEGIGFLKEQQWRTPFEVVSVRPGPSHVTIPAAAVWLSGDQHRVFVQSTGETFVSQPVTLGKREDSRIAVTDGLAPGDRVVTLGAASLAACTQEESHEHLAALTPVQQQLERLNLTLQPARAGGLNAWIRVPGEIKLNNDTTAHMVPRTGGIAREVRAHLGEQVKAGQVLAVIESRDLATAKADYLALIQRLDLAQSQFDREERLHTQQISSEAEYLDAKQKLAELQIQLDAARQKLLILGITASNLETLSDQADESFANYHLTAPFDGTIIRKHIVLGEAVDTHRVVFEIADLTRVWVDLTVNQKDIAQVQVGQPAVVVMNTDTPEVTASIQYVDPVIDPVTRAAVARVILDNTQGQYRPGLFVSGRIRTRQADARVIVPRDSIQSVDDERGVFVQCHGGFEFRPVITGLSDGSHIEILSGVQAGEPVVVRNAFHLKAEMTKKVGGAHAGHAH
jgi:cobalt-zinc-cadmium efflux system membrane fusion protein